MQTTTILALVGATLVFGCNKDGAKGEAPAGSVAEGLGAPPPPPHGSGRGIPAEAIAACASLTADAACTVKLGEHEIRGTCAAGPDGKLGCRPEGGPHGGKGPPSGH